VGIEGYCGGSAEQEQQQLLRIGAVLVARRNRQVCATRLPDVITSTLRNVCQAPVQVPPITAAWRVIAALHGREISKRICSSRASLLAHCPNEPPRAGRSVMTAFGRWGCVLAIFASSYFHRVRHMASECHALPECHPGRRPGQAVYAAVLPLPHAPCRPLTLSVPIFAAETSCLLRQKDPERPLRRHAATPRFPRQAQYGLAHVASTPSRPSDLRAKVTMTTPLHLHHFSARGRVAPPLIRCRCTGDIRLCRDIASRVCRDSSCRSGCQSRVALSGRLTGLTLACRAPAGFGLPNCLPCPCSHIYSTSTNPSLHNPGIVLCMKHHASEHLLAHVSIELCGPSVFSLPLSLHMRSMFINTGHQWREGSSGTKHTKTESAATMFLDYLQSVPEDARITEMTSTHSSAHLTISLVIAVSNALGYFGLPTADRLVTPKTNMHYVFGVSTSRLKKYKVSRNHVPSGPHNNHGFRPSTKPHLCPSYLISPHLSAVA
jgi:hypothetical protein